MSSDEKLIYLNDIEKYFRTMINELTLFMFKYGF